ncbi:MAG: NCS2 family permease [Bryobacterales bacterium]|nr:NCS2 family permease [Bryobacterales bacterium]
MSLRSALDRGFGVSRRGSTVGREVLAGCTTFLAMSYIIAVNPAILGDAGVPPAAAAFATCLAAGLGTVVMGLWARMPLAVAPGMGLNAYFAYSVVLGLGVPWQRALGLVFLAGVAFFVLSLLGVRQILLRMMPAPLLPAIGAGIGMFLVLIGLRNAGLVQGHETTLVTRGDFSDPGTLLAVGTLLACATLLARGVRAGILLAIVGATILSIPLGLAGEAGRPDAGSLGAVMQLDLAGAFAPEMLDVVFALLFVDVFDSLGTVIALIRKAGLARPDGRMPGLERVMCVDAGATVAGSLLGTSTLTTYIESATGIEAGGRTGLTAVVTGALFLLALPLAPLVAVIPSAAVAAPLVIVGASTVGLAREIDWDDTDIAVSALFTMAGIPLMFSIADGLAMGTICFVALRLLRGRGSDVPWPVRGLAALFLARFALLA